MSGRRRKIQQDESRSLGSQIPGLSLFVILLAFFIVLNSISIIKEDRARPLMRSIELAFATKITEDVIWQPSSNPSDDLDVQEGRTIDKLEAMFSSRIVGLEAKKDDSSGTLLLRMKYSDFSGAVRDLETGGSGSQEFLRTLASLLRAESSGYTYRMDVFVQVTQNPPSIQNQQPQKMAELLKQMGELAQILEGAGLPRKLMTIGMEKGSEGMVEILFRPHVPYNPLGDKREQTL